MRCKLDVCRGFGYWYCKYKTESGKGALPLLQHRYDLVCTIGLLVPLPVWPKVLTGTFVSPMNGARYLVVGV